MDYPENCLRGISKQFKNNISPEGKLTGAGFRPDDRTKEFREDRGSEVSVNWEDGDTVLHFTLTQEKDGRLQFQYGAVRLSVSSIQHVASRPGMEHTITYERAPLPENPYHGNIVFRDGLTKPTVTMIAEALAIEASTVFFLSNA